MIEKLEHFEGFTMLLSIGAMLKISTIKRVQDRLDAIHLEDDDEAESDLPRFSELKSVVALINDDENAALRLELVDVDNNALTMDIVYYPEQHKILTEFPDEKE